MLASTLEDLKWKQIKIYSTEYNLGLFKISVVVDVIQVMTRKLYSNFADSLLAY